MRDEHDDRVYQALRQDLWSNLGDVANSIAYAFDRLHARLYGAPWNTASADKPCTTRMKAL